MSLGRRSIDLLCLPKRSYESSVAIELKVEDWRRALWQAVVNFQLCEKSYIAIWHGYSHRVLNGRSLLDAYGVGLIEVDTRFARIMLDSKDKTVRIARKREGILDNGFRSVV